MSMKTHFESTNIQNLITKSNFILIKVEFLCMSFRININSEVRCGNFRGVVPIINNCFAKFFNANVYFVYFQIRFQIRIFEMNSINLILKNVSN